MTHPQAIQQFFSEVDPSAGPLDLLGVDRASITEQSVAAALKSRLDRLGAHPRAASTEAEEVRLALHVAAAQLLDPAVRAALLDDLRLSGMRRAAPTAPAALVLPEAFRSQALAAIAGARGWNRTARSRLAAIALRHGVDPYRAASALRSASRAMPASSAAVAVKESPSIPVRGRRRWPALLLLVALTASTVLLAERLATIQSALVRKQSESVVEPAEEIKAPIVEQPNLPAPSTKRATPSPVITPSRVESSESEEARSAKPTPIALSEPVQRWLERAQVLLAARKESAEPREAPLARAVQLARLNLAARHLWSSRTDAAAKALRSAESAPALASADKRLDPVVDPVTITRPSPERDGELALELMALRRQPGGSLDSFKHRRFNSEPLGPADCDAAADTALFGSPNELRLIARKIVTDQSDNPTMVHALLAALPRASRQSTLSSLVAEIAGRPLPPIDEEAWPARARAALIERLVELAAARVRPDVDALADMLADAYAERDAVGPAEPIGAARLPTESAPPTNAAPERAGAPLAEQEADAMWKRILDEAAPRRARHEGSVMIDSIARARDSRLQLAIGPAQRFVAIQTSIVELFALIIEGEHPSASVTTFVESACVQRRAASLVFQQIEANERALAELWRARLLGAAGEGRDTP